MNLAPLAAAGTSVAAGAALLLSPAAAAAHPNSAHPATAQAGARHTVVVSSCVRATYKPSSYVLACADDNAQIHHATYSAWHRNFADGRGTYVYNTCEPDCAAGTFKHHPVSFTLGRARTIDGQRQFTRISVSYAGLTETFPLGKV